MKKLPIWLNLFLIISLVTLPVIYFQYLSQKNALSYFSDLLLNEDIESALGNNLETMKKLKEFLNEEEQKALKETFQKHYASLTVYKSLNDKKQELREQFLSHTLIITFGALVIALLAAILLAKSIVSTFRQLNDNLFQKEIQLREKNELENWQQMARRVIHELKGPITPIKLIGGDLVAKFSKGQPSEAYVKEAQSIILDEVHNIENLISNFSEFARLPKAKIEEHDLIHTVNNFIKKYSFENITYIKPREDFLSIDHDPDMIERLLVNLVRNAKEANTDQKNLQLSFYIEKAYAYYKLIVQDNGKGIEDENFKKIFEPYYSRHKADDSVSNMNFGLGLSICKKIALEHNGKIEVEESYEGARFALYLPYSDNK